MTYISRRNVLRGSAAVGFMSGAGLLSRMGEAYAANTSGYKALVCLFLKGGMDGTDAVLPLDKASHDALGEHRRDLFTAYNVGSGASKRDRANLLELSSARTDFGGRRFALPPEMAEMHRLYQDGRMAVVGNVGPLIMPTTRSQMDNNTVELPSRLFSHNDQQSTWMSMGLEGKRFGWGGEFADKVAPTSGAGLNFASITATSPDAFLDAGRTRQYPVSSGGPVKATLTESRWILGNDADEARRILLNHYGSDGVNATNTYQRDMASSFQDSLETNRVFGEAFEARRDFTTVFPNTGLGKQLQTIAETISVRGALGANRQLFYAAAGGFDTHATQARDMPQRLQELSEAIAAFSDAMAEMGMGDEVTLFTASDFGRTVVVNGDGTDHGWGGHHFVVGGAVRGGEIYGNVPSMDLGLESYTASRGRLIPDLSVDQYAGSLGRWFGLSDAELRDALPNLGNFGSMPDMFGLGASV